MLPPLAKELGLDFGDSGWFLGLGSLAAGFSTILMIWLNNRYAVERVIIILAAMGVITCAIAPMVSSFTMLIVLAVFSGSLVSMLGSLSNILVVSGSPEAKQGRMLSALHSMYGVGAAFASWSVGFSISKGMPWWILFTGCLPLFLLLYPLASGNKPAQENQAANFQSPNLFRFQLLAIAIFCLYVAGEVTTSMWMTSWLMSVKKMSIEDATLILSSFFGVLLATRMLCAVFMAPKWEMPVLIACLAIPPTVMFLVLQEMISPWFLLAIGLFGPFFPVFLSRVNRSSPTNWRSLTIWAIVAMNFLLAGGHLFLGKLANAFGIGKAFYLPVVALSMAFLTICTYFVLEKRLLARATANGK